MQEKRKHVREPIDCALKVRDTNRNQAIGCLVDLSEDGFMLLSNQPYEAGSVLQLSFELPAPVNGQLSIAVGAESLWCSAANKAEHFWAGFRIIDASDTAIATLAIVTRNNAGHD
jgi:hypothetical protein